jgi:cyclophilin family peptidyl-prolyl cis-trans isomerase
MQAARLLLLGLAVLALIAACWLTGCGSGTKGDIPAASVESALGSTNSATAATSVSTRPAKPRPAPPKPVDPVIVLHTSAGDIQLQLFREKAPQTVDNFLQNYALRQFYDGTIFHHVEAGSMIIGGGYSADLAAKETRSPIYNESQNGLKNKRGMVAMIRDPANTHSATSQFFINLADNPSLDFRGDQSSEDGIADEDWGYCVFGQVIAGLDVVDQIAQAQVAAEGDFAKMPVQPITITSLEQVR